MIQGDKLYNQRCPTCGQTIAQPRSIGDRSQNNRTHGNCASIAQQINERNPDKPPVTPAMVYEIMKRFAVKDGVYPGIKFNFAGTILIEPISQADATMKEVNGFCNVINRYADENDMWLWEYTQDGKTKYKSIGGRTLEEMLQDYPELNRELRPPEQDELEIF
jgi:hypothetical protein